MAKNAFKINLCAYHNEVTGSRLLLVIKYSDGDIKRVLIDCGYFQEIKYRYLNYVDDINPNKIDAILITHNHIDHTGLLPKMVKNGYSNPIYMTKITKTLLGGFLYDCCEQQDENCKYIQNRYSDFAYMFSPLYQSKDVENTLKLCIGKDYSESFYLFENDKRIKVTFFENGHILGSSMILIECKQFGKKPINFLFTGDYKLTNSFYYVPVLPKRVRNMELIMIHEATYGTTNDTDIKNCFESNLIQAFNKRQHILIGAFAQGRMQEILFRLRKMQNAKKIPSDYEILLDGKLGINTTNKYLQILKWYNPKKADFIPDYRIVDPKERANILNLGHPVILVTTSGMFSNGPAKMYTPMFLQHPNAMIHVSGYAAEETLARTLLETKYDDIINIDKIELCKKATIRTTKEMTSHATLNEMIRFINQFKKIRFLAVNHGSSEVKDAFINYVENSCENVELVDVLDRSTMYSICQLTRSREKSSNIKIKKLSAGLDHLNFPFKPSKRIITKRKNKQAKKYININSNLFIR